MITHENDLIQSLRKEIAELKEQILYLEEQSYFERSDAYEEGWNDAQDQSSVWSNE